MLRLAVDAPHLAPPEVGIRRLHSLGKVPREQRHLRKCLPYLTQGSLLEHVGRPSSLYIYYRNALGNSPDAPSSAYRALTPRLDLPHPEQHH